MSDGTKVTLNGQRIIISCYGRRNKCQNLRRGFSVRQWMISEIKRVKFLMGGCHMER